MIKCLRCGKELEDGSTFCNACGAKQQNSKKKENNLKAIFAIIIGFVIIIAVAIFVIFKNSNSIDKKSQRLIENDLGTTITTQDIYLYEESNVVLVKFLSKGETDYAMIYLDDNSIYYESVFEKIDDPYELILYNYDPIIAYHAIIGDDGYVKIK